MGMIFRFLILDSIINRRTRTEASEDPVMKRVLGKLVQCDCDPDNCHCDADEKAAVEAAWNDLKAAGDELVQKICA